MANMQVTVVDGNNVTVSLDRGVAGVGIASISLVVINQANYLLITYTNGTTQTVGPVGVIQYNGTTPINISGSTISLLTVPVNLGGTGQTTANAGFNALAPTQTTHAGKYLKTDGTNSAWDALDISTADITGTLPIVNGGTGQTTANAGLNALLPAQASQANKYLQTDGTNASWDAISLSTADITGILPVANGGTGVSTSTGTGNTVLSNSPTLVTPVLGTPASGTLTNATGLPVATGISGLGTGIATFLATPSSANLAAALTDETGTGAAVFATSPTLVTPALGTPASGVMTNVTGTAAGLTAGNVTTNANLTGMVTSVGNATTVITNANLTGDITSVGNATAISAGVIVNADINASAAIADTKLATIATALKVSNSATTAASANTASAIVARDASGNFTAGTVTAALTGNASTATTLATGRTIAITGDLAYTSPSFDGSANVTAAGTLATVATAGVTGSSTAIPVVTINAKGLTTSITTAAVIAPAGTLSGSTLAAGVTGSSLTSLGTIANLSVTAGTISTTPSASTDIANKDYVDTVAQGLDPKASCVAATTVNITLSGTQTIDGVALIAADRCLVKNQTTQADNGIYVVASGAWARSADMNAWAEVPGAFTFIEQGTQYADTGWVCTSNAGGTLGTTAITFVQFAGAGSYTASTGLTLTGTAFSLTAPVTVALGGTNATSAGITSFNNITGYTAAGATGTTSTNLVFSTSPTLVTPILGTPQSATLTNATGLPLTTGVTGTLPVANGGTGLASGTSGGVLAYTASGTLASSAALAASALVIGGGAGAAPSTTTTGTGVVTALGVNIGTAGAFVVNGGALGTPSSGTVTNLTGTASININGTVGATTATTGAFTTVTASTAIGTASGGTGLGGATPFTSGGVVYASSTSALVTGSALTFDGTNFTTPRTQVTTAGTPPASGAGIEIVGGTTPVILSYNRGTSAYLPMTQYGSAFTWSINGASSDLVLTSTGLGIGASSPTVKLQVEQAANSAPVTLLRLNNSGTTAGGPGIASRISFTAGTTALGFVQGSNFASGAVGLQFSGDGINAQATLDSSGNLGLGVTPSAWALSGSSALQIKNAGVVGYLNSAYSTANTYFTSTGGTNYIANGFASYYSQISGVHAWSTAASGTAGNPITFTQAMTLDASGNLGIGQTSPTAPLHITTSGTANNIQMTGSGTAGTYVQMTNTGGIFTAGLDNSTGGVFGGTAYSGNLYMSGAYPLLFWTNNVERARIDSSGNLGIGTSSPLSKLDVRAASAVIGNYQTIQAFSTDTSAAIDLGGGISLGGFYNSTQIAVFGNIVGRKENGTGGNYDGYLAFGTNAQATGVVERVRIDSSGNLLVGITSTSVTAGGIYNRGINAGGSSVIIGHQSGVATGNSFSEFQYNGSIIGYISQNGTTAVAYNTSSDYRLKNSVAPMTGALAKVALLKPCTYKWNADGSDGEGFIAHELAEVVPHAVTGAKDAVDEDGNPVYQGIDTSFLVATLTAAIQEQQAIIESLKARLSAANL